MKKDKCGSKLIAKKGVKAKACPKCGKVHAGKCGCKAKKHQFGGIIDAMQKLQKGGSLNSIPFSQKGNILPEIIVKSKRPYRFDRRISNIGGGHGVISDILWNSHQDGQYMGDLSGIAGGRTIYTSPQGNDTIYMNPQPIGYGMGANGLSWISHEGGFMPVPSDRKNQMKNRNAFYKNIRKSYVAPYDKESRPAFQRAKRGN